MFMSTAGHFPQNFINLDFSLSLVLSLQVKTAGRSITLFFQECVVLLFSSSSSSSLVCCVVQILIYIPSSISSTQNFSLSLSRFLLYASKDEKENFSSLPLAQVDVSAALHLLLKQDDGSSNHRDKKVVCVCPNVEY